MLSEARRQAILERTAGLLAQIDKDVQLHDVILDSTRQQLVLVMQKNDMPVLVGLSYLDYVSHRDEDFKKFLREGLAQREAAARKREQEDGS